MRRQRRPRNQLDEHNPPDAWAGYPPGSRAAWWAAWWTVGVHLWWTWP